MRLSDFRHSQKPVFQLVRFGFSSAVTICVKVGITLLLAQGINEYLSYFLTHLLVLFWSYYSHLRFTFRETHSWLRFWHYTKAVFFIKLADYLIFSVFLQVAEDQISLGVLIASLAMNVVRFVSIRKAIRHAATAPAKADVPMEPV